MRKLTLAFLTVVALVLPSLPAVAQKSDPVRVRFIDMGATVITGTVKTPTVLRTDGRERPDFGPLYQARKSFLTVLEQSGSDPALR